MKINLNTRIKNAWHEFLRKEMPSTFIQRKTHINYEYDLKKSPEESFIEVAMLCARGFCTIDLQGGFISGLTLVFNHEVTLQNSVVEIQIPMSNYPNAQNIRLFNNQIVWKNDNRPWINDTWIITS